MVAVMITIYLITFLGDTLSLSLPLTLIVAGISLFTFFGQRIRQDIKVSQKEFDTTILYTAMALIAMIGAGVAYANRLSESQTILGNLALFIPPATIPLSLTDQILHGQLFAIAEEVFFRGAVLTFILWQLPTGLNLNIPFLGRINIPEWLFAPVTSGVIFGIYHLAAYGLSGAFWYVTFAGTFMTVAVMRAFRNRGQLRLTPAILAHMVNNFLVVLI